MNFLGHLWLADLTDTSLAGSILGDMVRGNDYAAYPAEIALGIRLHRRVDTLTDRHPIIVDSLQAFPTELRRYGTVLIDMVSDHCLATRWSELHPETLGHFASRAGREVASAGRWFRQAGARAPLSLYFSELLKSYQSPTGVEAAMGRVAQRLKRPEPMMGAIVYWKGAAERLAPQLPELMADLRSGVNEAIGEFSPPASLRYADPSRSRAG